MHKISKTIVATLLATGLSSAAVYVQSKNDAMAVTQINVSLERALAIARNLHPGTSVGAELKNQQDQQFGKVEILTDKHQVFGVKIDAMTAAVIEQTLDTEDNDEDNEEDEEDEEDEEEGN